MLKEREFTGRDWLKALAVLMASAFFLLAAEKLAGPGLDYEDAGAMHPFAAKVTEIIHLEEEHKTLEGFGEVDSYRLRFRARVGAWNGEQVEAIQSADSLMGMQIDKVRVGDRVLLYYDETAGFDTPWMMGEYNRLPGMIWLTGAFFLLLFLVGKGKGIRAAIALGLAVWAFIRVFLLAVLSGKSIVQWVCILCIFTTVSSISLVCGVNRKSLCAAAGCILGTAAAGAVTAVMSRVMHLSGMTTQESYYITCLGIEPEISLLDVFFAGVLIGAVGAMMDVSVSVSSALWELRQEGKAPTVKSLIRSGMEIGRDMMGTMTNTLVLAYLGGSLVTVILLAAYGDPPLALLSRELLADEVVRALAGSIGIVLSIPFTAVISALIFCAEPHKKDRMEQDDFYKYDDILEKRKSL